MKSLSKLLNQNLKWVDEKLKIDPQFFKKLSKTQNPDYLWIGCSDSRVPANEIVGLNAGEMFVHRNVANLVEQTDLNCLSVIQYAVEVLKVEHIIVCGHYGCGGVKAAMENKQHGLIDNWLSNIKETYRFHKEEIEKEPDTGKRIDLLCEFNVAHQVANVAQTTIVQNSWQRKQKLAVHGLIYNITDGILKDLDIRITNADQLEPIYKVKERRGDRLK